MVPLTARQQELLDYIRSCERSPSFIEMRDALGLTSKSGVHRLVAGLEERGFIRRLHKRARAIEVIDDAHLPQSVQLSEVPFDSLLAELRARLGSPVDAEELA